MRDPLVEVKRTSNYSLTSVTVAENCCKNVATLHQETAKGFIDRLLGFTVPLKPCQLPARRQRSEQIDQGPELYLAKRQEPIGGMTTGTRAQPPKLNARQPALDH